MTHEVFSRSITKNKRIALPILKAAISGDVEAMTLIQHHFDSYIHRLATVGACGTYALNMELHDRLKTRLIVATLKFRL